MEEDNVSKKLDDKYTASASAEELSEVYERQSRRYCQNLDVGSEVER